MLRNFLNTRLFLLIVVGFDASAFIVTAKCLRDTLPTELEKPGSITSTLDIVLSLSRVISDQSRVLVH